jgi:hypothetical protein
MIVERDYSKGHALAYSSPAAGIVRTVPADPVQGRSDTVSADAGPDHD